MIGYFDTSVFVPLLIAEPTSAPCRRLWDELEVVDVNDRIVRRAAQPAYTCALRGYDAIHCASAEQLNDSDLVVAVGDRKLLKACLSLHGPWPGALSMNSTWPTFSVR